MGGGGVYNAGFIDVLVSNLIGGNTDAINNSPDMFSAAATPTPGTPPSGIYQPALPSPLVAPIFEGLNFVGDCGPSANCGLTNDTNLDIVGGSSLAMPPANIPPGVLGLAWNGGPTQTVALSPDSPAINNGFNNLGLSYDQRGPEFFRTVAETDIGAWEAQYDL